MTSMQRIATRAALLAGALLASTQARAEDRDFCADRPGRGTPACTLAPGNAMVEVGVAGFDHDADAQSTSDTFVAGDTLFRLGVTDETEIQLGLTSYTRVTSRDRAGGMVIRQAGVGDGYVAVRRGLAGANGPAAIEAFVTLPLGKPPAGAGDWGAGVLVPFSHDLPGDFSLELTPEIDAAVNASGSGRHLAYGGVIGLSHALGRSASLSGEFAGFRDEDPAGHAFDGRVAGSIAWQLAPRLQLDVETDLSVTHAAPKTSLLFGFALRL